MKNIRVFFYLKFFIYLNRRVFVMGRFSLVYCTCVACRGLFGHPLGVIERLCSVSGFSRLSSILFLISLIPC